MIPYNYGCIYMCESKFASIWATNKFHCFATTQGYGLKRRNECGSSLLICLCFMMMTFGTSLYVQMFVSMCVGQREALGF